MQRSKTVFEYLFKQTVVAVSFFAILAFVAGVSHRARAEENSASHALSKKLSKELSQLLIGADVPTNYCDASGVCRLNLVNVTIEEDKIYGADDRPTGEVEYSLSYSEEKSTADPVVIKGIKVKPLFDAASKFKMESSGGTSVQGFYALSISCDPARATCAVTSVKPE